MKIKAIYNQLNDTKIHYASQEEMSFGSGTKYPLCWDNFNNKLVRGAPYYSPTNDKVNCPECLKKVNYIKSLQE